MINFVMQATFSKGVTTLGTVTTIKAGSTLTITIGTGYRAPKKSSCCGGRPCGFVVIAILNTSIYKLPLYIDQVRAKDFAKEARYGFNFCPCDITKIWTHLSICRQKSMRLWLHNTQRKFKTLNQSRFVIIACPYNAMS